MLELMAWLEASALANLLRGLGIWTYGLLNLGHILGVSMLFGMVLLLDLRLLGLWQRIPLAAIIGPTVPLAAIGFGLAVITGIMMLSFNTTDYHGNPFLYLKLPMVVLGMINVVVFQRFGAWQRARDGQPAAVGDQGILRLAGGLSLAIWLTVVICGRMIGYW